MNLIRTAMLLAFMTALFMAVGYLVGGGSGMIIAFFMAMGMNLFSYWNSDKIVLRMYNAQEADRYTAPEYYRIVQSLAEKAGLPLPRLYIIDNPQPNAFATGRNPEHAAVAVTTGLLQRLSEDELTGVLAHELSHIKNYDTLTMTITAMLAGAISMLGNFALFMGHSRDSNGNSNPLGMIGALVAMIVAPLAAMMIQMAISRTREYAADRRGAEICGNPLWLASALKKIAGGARDVTNEAAEHNPATAHMFIINPLAGEGMDNLFSTHPATENRIAALRRMEQQMHGNRRPPAAGAETDPETGNRAVIKRQRPAWMRIKHGKKPGGDSLD